MAGSITVSSITLDSDNNFSIKSNTGATLFFANTSGVDIANSIGATAITSDKILSIANTKISGNIISSQITSVANTQITGNIISSQIASVNGSVITANTIANSAIQTGAVENYMNATGLSFGMRNRIINGAMVISQRSNTTATTVNTNDVYTLDRFKCWASGGGVFTVTQSTTAPTGFNNSALVTVTTADASIAAGDNYRFAQAIEGYNIADFGFGTASASTVTLSFWVRSNITGTFGGSLYSVGGTRAYVFNYTINAANTFEQKTVTIAGDTSGTWGTINSTGITVYFDLGSGSTYENATGAWVAAEKFRTSGNATLISTLSNTWYITGIQLEKGSTATSFDYRPYGTELALCQRYCCVIPVNASGIGTGIIGPWGANYNSTNGRVWYSMPVTMRTTPSVSLTGNQYSIIGVSDVATGTNNNFHYSNQIISFDGTSLSSSSATGQPLNYRGGGLITAEL